MNELKPCPFCGETELIAALTTGVSKLWGHGVCQSCGASGPIVLVNQKESWQEEARKRWNERPNAQSHTCSLHNYVGKGSCPACEQLKKTIGG